VSYRQGDMSSAARDVFIVNPRSAAGSTLRRFERVQPQFTARLPNLEVWLTASPGHATELARQALRENVRTIVAVGGDGTNHEVLNGFFDEQGKAIGGETAFGMVTSGTGGDFRRSFGWSEDPLEALERIVRRDMRRIDVGRMCYRGPEGNERFRHFLNIGSFGIGGDIVDTVNHSSKAWGAKASFLLGTVRHLVGYQPQRVRLICDGKDAFECDVTAVAVANGQFFGGGMHVAPNANVEDGLFHTVIIEGGGPSLWLKHGLKLYSGRHEALPQVRTIPLRRLDAEPLGARPVLIELDGEACGQLPVSFEVVPRALPLLM
jgi:diacylglycerol kinase (ATP)